MAFEFSGDFVVQTPRKKAFAVLSDAALFSPLLPTYRSHELLDDGSSNVTVQVGVGKIRGTAVVNLKLAERKPPEAATWSGKGQMMGCGFNFTAAFGLDELGPEETRVRWRGDLTIHGRLMSLAGGALQPVARRKIQELVDAIQRALGGGSGVPDVPQHQGIQPE